MESKGEMIGGRNIRGGPCGACKFLRRKCMKGCVFAPYFDQEQGTAQFAAVHKVFGASNAAKLLLRVPAPRRLDTVLTLCYEALTRLRDPVYGIVAHIFALQHQVTSNLPSPLQIIAANVDPFHSFMVASCSLLVKVANLQEELAYVHARLSDLQEPTTLMPEYHYPPSSTMLQTNSSTLLRQVSLNSPLSESSGVMATPQLANDVANIQDAEDDLQILAREFITGQNENVLL